MRIAAIILAAGGSRRLGQPKQLLRWNGETLLNRAIRLAGEAGAEPVIAVLGAGFDAIRASIESTSVITVHNDRWQQGMGCSIAAGMRALEVGAPEPEAVLLMGCDQPRLTVDHLRALMETASTHGSPAIAASEYAGVVGVPAVFPRATFTDLRVLRGEKGARAIIERAPCAVLPVQFAGGNVDIDRPEDLNVLG